MSFDTVVVVDWSGAGTPSPARSSRDAIWFGIARETGTSVSYHRTRDAATAALIELFEQELAEGRRVLAGVDFSLAYPRGFARALTGSDDPLGLWPEIAARIKDRPDNTNNRFEAAAGINRMFPGKGPFWGNGLARDIADLPRTKDDYANPFAELRPCEATPGAQTSWKLAGVGSVGSQTLLGIARLQNLRDRFGTDLAVRPFETREAPITLVELFPSLIAQTIADLSEAEEIRDRAQVRILATALRALDPQTLEAMSREGDAIEGWILGLGHERALDASARRVLSSELVPPRLRDDCFAMPQGVAWVPVDEAQARLRAALVPVTATETLRVAMAGGRVLADPVHARRSNPPAPNSAVDGYGFAHAATGAGVQRLPLLKGRAAAGQPYEDAVPEGAAIRILTGAILPAGVDTVVLEEDTATDGATLVFDGPIKPRANTRKAGEDLMQGDLALPAGHRLRAPDLALLSALGVSEVSTYRPLRAAVLSTGDEILSSPDQAAAPHQIYDANRPMLLDLARGWGHRPVDLGHARDDRGLIAEKLDAGARDADVILTSGGASAGDEDHVSALLKEHGHLTSWRIALKPGRPLALALWNGVPVFGLPGNPVAALVCALIFARPALSLLSGQGWSVPRGYAVPAAFSKSKKPGRREYLRARLTPEGAAEVFASEGSGRISGLAWADGLVELPDDAVEVRPGTPVRYIPYTAFGLV